MGGILEKRGGRTLSPGRATEGGGGRRGRRPRCRTTPKWSPSKPARGPRHGLTRESTSRGAPWGFSNQLSTTGVADYPKLLYTYPSGCLALTPIRLCVTEHPPLACKATSGSTDWCAPMIHIQGLQFTWVAGKQISDAQLEQCSELYSNHYGIYEERFDTPGGKRGLHIKMSPKRMRLLLDVDGAYAAFSYLGDKLVAYAFLVRGLVEPGGVVSWVTQLVVHTEYQNRKVATRLLHAAWGFSDHYAWGLATANPFAVRALEAATRRSCDPQIVQQHLEQLRSFTGDRINYFKGINFHVGPGICAADTRFYVSHSTLGEKMEQASKGGKPWTLGPLQPGMEWLAATVRSQPPRPLTPEDFERLLADQDGIVKEAYERMLLGTSHKWMMATPKEVDFVIANLGLRPGASVLDAGCGVGRHTVELAKRGYRVVGVDFVRRLLERAQQTAQEAGVADNVKVVEADCRTLDLGVEFDGAICLYDVVGSFPEDDDNLAILKRVAHHLKVGGRLLISVLNRGLMEAHAIHKGRIKENLDKFLELKPSNIMQKTGEIFNPQYLFYDPFTGVVYRKEQFELDNNIPCELVVRDRRYGAEELKDICRSVGIEPIWARNVRGGQWETNLPPDDNGAKEVLLLGERRQSA